MVAILNVATFLWLGACAAIAVRRLMQGERDTIFFVLIVHFIFCGVPPMLDVFLDRPVYRGFPGAQAAAADTSTCLIYCLYVSACTLIWWATGRSSRSHDEKRQHLDLVSSPGLRLLCYTLLLLPLPLACLLPGGTSLFEYGAILDPGFQETFSATYRVVNDACMYALLAALLLLSNRCNYVVAIVAVAVATWLNGKRHFVAFDLAVTLYVLWDKGWLRGARFAWAAVLAILCLAAYSQGYQRNLRSAWHDFDQFEEAYAIARVDYGRDHVIKLAIFSELYPECGTILEYRGQSCLYYLMYLLPRDRFPFKPLPYAAYATARARGIPPVQLASNLTTSVLEESIANFGWLGMLLGPLVVSAISRIGDRCHDRYVSVLTAGVCCGLLVVHFVAFLPCVITWVFFVTRHAFSEGARAVEQQRGGGDRVGAATETRVGAPNPPPAPWSDLKTERRTTRRAG